MSNSQFLTLLISLAALFVATIGTGLTVALYLNTRIDKLREELKEDTSALRKELTVRIDTLNKRIDDLIASRIVRGA